MTYKREFMIHYVKVLFMSNPEFIYYVQVLFMSY